MIKVYPNPSKGLFTLELRTASVITVSNSLGQIILNEILSAGKKVIEIKNQSAGIYFLSVNQENKQQILKLIIE